MAANDYEEFWDAISRVEEADLDDEKINRLLRFREVQHHLSGVCRILDVGAATGAYSIPLAKLGYDVTHLDISDEMIRTAREKAKGLDNICFVKQDAADLSMFCDDAFDLVLCFDGAISFSGHNANKVISEICRVARKVLLSVSSKSCMTATWLNYSLSKLNRIHPAVKCMMETGYFCKSDYNDADALTDINELKAYDVDELRAILRENGMSVLECRSIGSLSHLYLMHLYRRYPAEIVHEKITEISEDAEFLDMCDYFDRNVMPEGMGSFRRAGILAVAEKE